MSFEDNREVIKTAITDAAFKGVKAACMLVESQAKLLAPVKLGFLRDQSIEHKVEMHGSQIEGAVGSNADYAAFVEFGTGEFAENGEGRKGGWSYKDNEGKWHYTLGNKPQPFIRPAFRQNEDNISKLIGKEFSVKFGGDT